MKKANYLPGKEFRIFPHPKNRVGSDVPDDRFVVVSKDQDSGISFKHSATGQPWFLYWDSLQEYREPNCIFVKGQLWFDKQGIVFEPGFDHRKIQALADTVGLGVYLSVRPGNSSAEEDREGGVISGLISGQVTGEKISALKRMLPVVKFKSNELQILLALVAWWQDFDGADGGLSITSRGIRLATELELMREKAVFCSHRAVFLTWKWADADMQGWFNNEATKLTGFPFVTVEESKGVLQKLRDIDADINNNIAESAQICEQTMDLKLIGLHYSNAIIVQGLKALHLRNFKVAEWVVNKERLKQYFYNAKGILIHSDRQEYLGYLYHNAANQLRFLDELDEAEGLAKEANRIGLFVKDTHLSDISSRLLQRISEMREGK